MENQEKNTPKNFSILYLLAAVTGIATAWVCTGSLLWIIIGAVLGLILAGFYINVLIKGREEA